MADLALTESAKSNGTEKTPLSGRAGSSAVTDTFLRKAESSERNRIAATPAVKGNQSRIRRDFFPN
jgi:hypothetical protein